MNDDPFNTDMPPDELLVAYLDGELDPESRRRFEEQLATNAPLRRRLKELENTWELLDDLDATPAGDRFTQSTLEMVAVAAGKDVEQDLAEAPRRRRRNTLRAFAAALAAAMLGFLAVALFWPNSNREILDNLSVLENLDQYRQIGNIEFLQMLAREGLFPKESGETAAAVPMSQGDPLQRIGKMDADEKEQLMRRKEQFDDLGPDRQKQLQELDKALREDDDPQILRPIMRRYNEWLKTLSSFTRAELIALQPAERVQRVKKHLYEEEIREGGKRPPQKDIEKIRAWMNDHVRDHEKQFLKMLPEPRQQAAANLTDDVRLQMVRGFMAWHWRTAGAGKPAPLMTDADLARLRKQLSAETRQRLESKPIEAQWQMVAVWMQRQRPSRGPLPKADDERLAKFFEENLTDEERDWLMNMPGEDMQRELQRLYLTRTGSHEGPGRRPEGLRRELRPGNWPPPKRP
jgi:hypothetical protein